MEREPEDRHLVLEPRRQGLPRIDEKQWAIGVKDLEMGLFPDTPGPLVIFSGASVVLRQRRHDESVEFLDRRVLGCET